MAHVRKQLRDWLKANLVGSAQAGSRVEVRRSLPLEKTLEPTFVIQVQGERSQDDAMGGKQMRTIEVRIVACAKGDAEATEDILDAMGVFVEGVFSDSPDLGGLAFDYAYTSTEFAFTGTGEQTFCTAAFTFAVLVRTDRTNPETAL